MGKKTVLLAPLAAAALSLTALATGASADTAGAQANYDGICNGGEACFYYNSNSTGSVADFSQPVYDFASARFLGEGNGKGQGVKNNAASVCNYNSTYHVMVFFNSNHEGAYDVIPPGDCENLVKTYNENASFTWLKLG